MIRGFCAISCAFLLTACAAGSGNSNTVGASGSLCSLGLKQENLVGAGKLQITEGLQTLSLDQPSTSRDFTVLIKSDCKVPGFLSDEIVADESVNPSGANSYHVSLDADADVEEFKRRAMADECVLHVADSHLVQSDSASDIMMAGDPLTATQNHLKTIHAEAGYAAIANIKASSGMKPKDVVIAVIDSGVDMSHPDLKANLWVNPGEIPANGIDDDRNGYIDDVYGYNFASHVPSPQFEGNQPHGTHVAGLAAARANNGIGGTGVMGFAKIMALNAFGKNSEGAYDSDIENAIRYAADNGADVINLSLGGGGQADGFIPALNYAISKGVTILAAAGNSGLQLGNGYFVSPGSFSTRFKGMLSVGSVDLDDSLSTFSNFGASVVKIAATGAESSSRGIGLLSTFPGNTYARMMGTSMATPVVSGAAALAIYLMRAKGYRPTPAQIETILTNSARSVSSLVTRVNGGRVMDIGNLVAYIDRTYSKSSSPAITCP